MYLPHTAPLPGQGPFPLVASDEDCGFEGNSDLYGLGIRLGIYMQWLSSFAPRAGSQSLGLLLQTYFTFVFAIFVAILVLTAEKRPTHTVEIFVLTYIMFGGSYTMLMAAWPSKTRVANIWEAYGVSPFYLGFLLCLIEAVALYSLWFWLCDVQSDHFLATPCGSHAFVFAKVSLSNRAVTKALAAMSGIVAFSPILLPAQRSALLHLKRVLADKRTRSQPDAAADADSTTFHDIEADYSQLWCSRVEMRN